MKKIETTFKILTIALVAVSILCILLLAAGTIAVYALAYGLPR